LSERDRQLVESWLVEFDLGWTPDRLSARARELPADSALRLPALVEMVKIDLERQWQRGERRPLEAYLHAFPELAAWGTVTGELLLVEYQVRRQFGDTADPDDYERRFPGAAELLRPALDQGSAPGHDTLRPEGSTVAPPPLPSPFPTAAPGALPPQFGRYRIVKLLGKGGMGSVYLAHDSKLDRPVALKVPSFSAEDDATLLERFYREARAAATIDHPNLCPVYDVGQVGGAHYLTMAYIEGESLAQRILKKPGLSQREAAGLVRKVALGVGEAHAHGVIHRDLKPNNIMLNRRGEPVVMDFGLARRSKAEDLRLTPSGSMLGTPAYMPPEQVRGDADLMGPGSDVYSLGVVLYELLTGQLPFVGSFGAVMADILTRPPRPPSSLRPDVEPQLEAICLKALAKAPGDRYAGMADFAAALEEYLSTPGPRPTAGSGPRRATGLALLGGAAALLVVAAVIVIKTRQGEIRLDVPEDKPIIQVNGKTVHGEQPGEKGKAVAAPAEATAKLAEKRQLTGFSGAVRGVAFSADGKRAVAAGEDGSIPGKTHAVRGWDLETGKLDPAQPRGHLCHHVVFAPDGRRYLEGGGLQSASVWDVDSARSLRRLNVGPHLHCGAFSRDGRRVILGGETLLGKPWVGVWELETGRALLDFHPTDGEVRCVALSPDGRRGFSAGKKSVRLWDVEKGQGQELLQGVHVESAEFSPDGKLLAVGTAMGTIRVLDAATGAAPRLFEEKHASAVTCLAFAPDGKRLVSGGADKTVRIWDVATGKEIQCLTGHADRVTAVAFSGDGRRALSGSADRTVRLWAVAGDN
jgi:hypothetical protein